MQDMGIILKLVDNGYYEAVGRNVQSKFKKFALEEWEPIMYQTMIPADIALSVGLTLAIITFIVEGLHGQKKQIPHGGLLKHHDVTRHHSQAWLYNNWDEG